MAVTQSTIRRPSMHDIGTGATMKRHKKRTPTGGYGIQLEMVCNMWGNKKTVERER